MREVLEPCRRVSTGRVLFRTEGAIPSVSKGLLHLCVP